VCTGARSRVHQDDHSTHGWLVQLAGRKKVWLWPPHAFPYRKHTPQEVILEPWHMLYIPFRWAYERSPCVSAARLSRMVNPWRLRTRLSLSLSLQRCGGLRRHEVVALDDSLSVQWRYLCPQCPDAGESYHEGGKHGFGFQMIVVPPYTSPLSFGFPRPLVRTPQRAVDSHARGDLLCYGAQCVELSRRATMT
jgi:hypothetical protein